MSSELKSGLNEIDSDNSGKLNTTKKVAKTNAQRQREFQQRKRNQRKSTKKPPKTNAEHQKAYRERQKMKKNENKRESNAILNAPSTTKITHSEYCKEYQQTSRLKKQPVQLDSLLSEKGEVSQSKKIKLVDAQNVTNEEVIMKHNEVSTDRINSSMQLRSSPYSSCAPSLLEMGLNEPSSSEPVDIKPFIHNPWFALNATPSPALDPKPPSIQNEDSSSSNVFTADENSSYFQFFRAIHSEFLELSPKKQRQFKKKCLDYLYELLDEEDNSHQRRGYSHQDNVLNLSNSGHLSEEEKDVKPVVEDGYILSSN